MTISDDDLRTAGDADHQREMAALRLQLREAADALEAAEAENQQLRADIEVLQRGPTDSSSPEVVWTSETTAAPSREANNKET